MSPPTRAIFADQRIMVDLHYANLESLSRYRDGIGIVDSRRRSTFILVASGQSSTVACALIGHLVNRTTRQV